MTLPMRVKERPYERDDQRREAVPLVEGEGRLVVKKLNAGAYGVRKIIEFRKPKGEGSGSSRGEMGDRGHPPLRARAREGHGSHRRG